MESDSRGGNGELYVQNFMSPLVLEGFSPGRQKVRVG